jgi:hypothetical protein
MSSSEMIEAAVLGVPFIAAVVYLVVELADLKIWWNKRRNSAPSSFHKGDDPGARHRPIGDTWPQRRRAEAEEEWKKALEKNHDADS